MGLFYNSDISYKSKTFFLFCFVFKRYFFCCKDRQHFFFFWGGGGDSLLSPKCQFIRFIYLNLKQ